MLSYPTNAGTTVVGIMTGIALIIIITIVMMYRYEIRKKELQRTIAREAAQKAREAAAKPAQKAAAKRTQAEAAPKRKPGRPRKQPQAAAPTTQTTPTAPTEPTAQAASALPAIKGNNAFAGQIVAFTGKLAGMTHSEAAALVNANGGKAYAEAMYAGTTMLVVADDSNRKCLYSGKRSKAEEWTGTREISESYFKELCAQPLTLTLDEFAASAAQM